MYLRSQENDQQRALWRSCSACRGMGHRTEAHCSVCGQVLAGDDPWFEEEVDELSCGHEAAVRIKEHVCAHCGGNGRILEPVSSEEYEAWRRRQYVRGTFLLLLALVPAAAIGAAVAGAEPDLVCGSWWYSIAFFLGLGLVV